MNSGLKVITSASISNLACGFDVLGMAIDVPCDEIIGRLTDKPGIAISVHGFNQHIPLDPEKNTAGIAAAAFLKHIGEEGRGVEFAIRKHIPAGSGLGSSAASAVGAVVLVNELLRRPLEKKELIPFALKGETASGSEAGDNVIAAMMGGLIFLRDYATIDFHRIYTPKGLFMAMLLPDIFIPTGSARDVMHQSVTIDVLVKQNANLGAFIIAMERGDLDLIRRSMEDLVVEPIRKHTIPMFDEIKALATGMGSLGCSISGSGPAIFALCQEGSQAIEIGDAMKKMYDDHRLAARVFVGGINYEGARVY